MKRRLLNFCGIMALFVMIFTGCSSSGDTGSDPTVVATGISVEPKTVTLKIGETKDITASLVPAGASGTVTWTSSNQSVATVAKKNGYVGTITAVATGTCDINASIGTYTAKVSVTVNDSSNPGSSSSSDISVTLSQTQANLILGNDKLKSTTLTATVSGENLAASDKTVTWSVSPAGIVTVNNGVVTAVAKGEATVTATSTKDSTKKASCSVSVEDADSAKKLLWNVSDFSATSSTTATAYVSGTVSVTPTAGLVIDANSKKNGSYSFANRIKFSGTGSKSTVNVSFTLDGAAKVTVYALSGNSSNDRDLKLEGETVGVIGTVTAPGSYSSGNDSVPALVFNYTGDGEKVYLYSANSGINVYGIEIVYEEVAPAVYPTDISLSESTKSIDLANESSFTLTATVAPNNVTAKYAKVSWSSDNTEVATVDDNGKVNCKKAGRANITATTNTGSYKATCAVTVTGVSANVIKYTDKPLGFAGVNYTLPSFTSSNTVTVTTRAQLMSAISSGNKLIYIDGMIDMSDEGSGSKLPTEGADNTAVSSVMDSWIATKTSNAYKTYAEWVEAYAAACSSTSANDKEKSPSKGSNTSLYDTVWTLNKAWQTIIEIKPKSNTTIIGVDSNSGIRGGTINISGVSNVVIRNLTLIDAIDMFPHHEYDDGFNAQFDCITIQGSNTANIWIDHCTMKDTLVMQHVKSGTKEKWQNYDGLCDIKGDGKGITVSNCHMYHHDKTMLVGSSDDEGSNTTRKVSIINNHFDSCVQRLPMARNSQFHVLNNWYSFDTAQSVGDGKHQGDYCIGARKGALIISEANYFDSNMQYSIRGNKDTKSTTEVYDTDSVDKNSKKTEEYTAVSTAPFTVPYTYTPMTATEAKTYVETNAGAGKWPVQK